MTSFKALLLVSLAGLAYGEADPQEGSFFHQRPYPIYKSPPSQQTTGAEDVAQLRLNNFLLNGFRPPDSVPRAAFQMCTSSNNLNRERGVVQLLPGAAPRQCYFVIKVPDNTKGVAVHCSRVAVGNSAILDLVTLAAPTTQVVALSEGVVTVQPNAVYAIRYYDTVNSGSFVCDWRQVTAPPTTTVAPTTTTSGTTSTTSGTTSTTSGTTSTTSATTSTSTTTSTTTPAPSGG